MSSKTNDENCMLMLTTHEIPQDVLSINCGQSLPSSNVHTPFVPPIGEIISLLPLAYRLRYRIQYSNKIIP